MVEKFKSKRKLLESDTNLEMDMFTITEYADFRHQKFFLIVRGSILYLIRLKTLKVLMGN